MKVNRVRQNVLPILTALIWGTAFVAQSVGADYMGAFTFNAARAVIAFVFLLGLLGLRRLVQKKSGSLQPLGSRRDLMVGGLCCGTALTVASYLQQKGLETTTSGKAGFITALYIVLVPIIGCLMGRRVPQAVWLSVALAVGGLYCLCITEDLSIAVGDFYVLACALCFAVQIMTVDHFSSRVDGVALSCAQFFVMTLLSSLGVLSESLPDPALASVWLLPVLYVGVFSSGVAYTLQILAQKDSDPAVVSLLMSLESVFAAIAGAIILGDRMSGREYFGCALMLAAVVLAQIPLPDAGRKAAPDCRGPFAES